MSDPIADFLTRIRNAIMAGHKVVEAPSSKMRKEIARILLEEGYILGYKVVEGNDPCDTLKIALKYHPKNKVPAIKSIERISRPGLRRYTDVKNMPRVLNGLGIAIISTSEGLMTDKEARKKNIGGEVVCYVY
ncbi:MAG TPA: 30S ribosomal protein S8 [Bacteroidales bacterium]|nr:30S ribosomal protein S8 [Bacteroidales bacterium]HOU96014.1 30S ribosomal protein S8 [Bacteroidales bacterium]HQG35813.1 30S ribosomal protein S8 [Bacteroidales bacterium]HQG53283.1 30S ribosomal protein S8 [Bacteroidales bacterium]HQJ20717.1 30S ribosomal protein S8 [Bacteroidales bacterium]